MNTITINLPADTSLKALAQAMHGIGLGIDPAAKGLTFRRNTERHEVAKICSHPQCFANAIVVMHTVGLGQQSLCAKHWREGKEI